ncbi:MAG: NUDIX domain-containing protein [Patescibacteria group bacterium]
MGKIPFSPEQGAALEFALMRVEEDSGFWPTQKSFELVHSIEPSFAAELIILRKNDEGENEILLTIYHNRKAHYLDFEGKWHAPGGWVKCGDEDFNDACERIAERELTCNVNFIRKLGDYWWKPEEHPYGRPLSLLMLCEVEGAVDIHGECKFFPVKNLPENTIEVHRKFIEEFITIR